MNHRALLRIWYGRSPLAWLLLPFSWLFIAVSALRRALYQANLLRRTRVSKPVIIVGNITIGGVGKTPLVVWLAKELAARNHVVGVVLRGYGGNAQQWPRDVDADSEAREVGDEAVLIARATGGIVVAGPDRVRSATRAIERGATVILSDDGLQHYRLVRDFEIAVIDAARGFGNGFRLPAGPLRESTRRLSAVDAVVRNCRDENDSRDVAYGRALQVTMRSTVGEARSLSTDEVRPLSAFAGRRLHAIAGIGNPGAFFAALRAQGLQVDTREFADHFDFRAEILNFHDDAPVLMTEKDAVKCRSFADSRFWSVPLIVHVDPRDALLDAIVRCLDTHR